MRISYGNTWWGQQWLNALNNIDYASRLPRGKTYANKGRVKEMAFEGNRIYAKVQGSRIRPYKVALELQVFSPQQKAEITEAILENPSFIAQLLNRKLPPDLHQLCLDKGAELFPHQWQDLQGNCSCPDVAVPCKHIAAVLYLIANEIDADPFLIFRLHSYDLIQALENAGFSPKSFTDISILSLDALTEEFDDFYETQSVDGDTILRINYASLFDLSDTLSRILTEKPIFFNRGDFKKVFYEQYAPIRKNTQRLEGKETELPKSLDLDKVEDIEIWVDTNYMKVIDIIFRNSDYKELFRSTQIGALYQWLDSIKVQKLNRYSDAVKGLWAVQQMAKQLALHAAFVPQLIQNNLNFYFIRWIPALINEQVNEIFKTVEQNFPGNLLFYKQNKTILQPIRSDTTLSISSIFLNYLVQEGTKIKNSIWENPSVQLFYNQEVEPFNDVAQREYPAAIQLWLQSFYIFDRTLLPIIIVKEEQGEEGEDLGFTVSLSFQDTSKRSKPVFGLKSLLKNSQYEAYRMEALRDLAVLSDYYPEIKDLVKAKGVTSLYYTQAEMPKLLFNILPIIKIFGVKVVLPKSLRHLARPQLSMKLAENEQVGTAASGTVQLKNLLDFDWKIALGDQLVSPKVFKQLVKDQSGLIKFKHQYVFLDEKAVAKILDALSNPHPPTETDLLKVALAKEYDGAKIELSDKLQKTLTDWTRSKDVPVPEGLKATLRPYQQSGYSWMIKNATLGFGSLLADDMGLGKTLQVITTLLKWKEEGKLSKKKALVVVPTTLLTNWQKEILKFAPDLNVQVYHGTNRSIDFEKLEDIVLTTYGVLRADVNKLTKISWAAVIIDEAQNIKNAQTIQTKALKKIKADTRIAMSGTPVENRLGEYWSIFDFVNKGYLGTASQFTKTYALPIEKDRDQSRLDHFLKITAPFILRRLKSDKSIIADLPDKIEKDQYCSLQPEQTALYQKQVDMAMDKVAKASGIERKGLVLMLITTLKQICNHPYQYLKHGSKAPNLSGKTLLLFKIVQDILEKGEKLLLFTQYQQMGKLLVEYFKEHFDLEVPFLHGGISRKGRDEMVEKFQTNRTTRILILSLKAGGTGLNLTAANHVIHYDLWWNPAAEAQATDRAYRIGQQKNVMVHRLLTENTFEEKINQLLQDKKELANLTVSTGENWIGDMDDNDLKELVALSH